MSVQKNNLLELIQEDNIAQLCSKLVQFKSVNPPGDELEIAEYLSDLLKNAGLETQIVKHSSTRGSLIAKIKGCGEKPGVIYSGHIDVVPVGDEKWDHEPFSGVIDSGRVWGRGSTDMKGGDAAIITAAMTLVKANVSLKGDLILALTAGEETDCLGSLDIAKKVDFGPIQAIFIPEPTDNGLVIAERGALWVEITTFGKASHISKIQLGRNAVMMMLPILNDFNKLDIPFKPHPLVGKFDRSINTIHAGMKTNTIPDKCVVTIDMRSVPGQLHQEIIESIQKIIDDIKDKNTILDFNATLKVINNFPPLDTPTDNAVVQRFSNIVENVTKIYPEPKGAGYYTDAVGLVPAYKAPFIICGPGNPDLNHQVNEWVDISKMKDSAIIYTLTALEFLG
ncbi:MAG: M20 family metallopeptidase [Anaerolineales bacterium]|nr:M20 family metallopeptidase [Anaerolineales bacterium]